MLNHEERLKSFLDSINRETQEKYNKILGEIEEQSKKELDEAKLSLVQRFLKKFSDKQRKSCSEKKLICDYFK